MKLLDRVLQRWRIARARPFLAPTSRVLDVGSADGTLFHVLGLRQGLGIDPELPANTTAHGIPLVAGFFPEAMPATEQPFDAITLLAVLEHFPTAAQPALARACFEWLKPGGLLIITVPSPQVDAILAVLTRLRLVDGMSLEQHYGFKPAATRAIFEPAGFELVKARRFQLGLNNLFVFRRP